MLWIEAWQDYELDFCKPAAMQGYKVPSHVALATHLSCAVIHFRGFKPVNQWWVKTIVKEKGKKGVLEGLSLL